MYVNRENQGFFLFLLVIVISIEAPIHQEIGPFPPSAFAESVVVPQRCDYDVTACMDFVLSKMDASGK